MWVKKEPFIATHQSVGLINLLFWEFFTPALADGLSQESGGQQVCTSLLDFSEYSSQSLIIILLFWEFFTPASADGFPLESESQLWVGDMNI